MNELLAERMGPSPFSFIKTTEGSTKWLNRKFKNGRRMNISSISQFFPFDLKPKTAFGFLVHIVNGKHQTVNPIVKTRVYIGNSKSKDDNKRSEKRRSSKIHSEYDENEAEEIMNEPLDIDLNISSFSQRHLMIYWDFEKEQFCIQVLGPKAIYMNSRYYSAGIQYPIILNQGSIIKIDDENSLMFTVNDYI